MSDGFKLYGILAFGTAGKDLTGNQSDLMRQPMTSMGNSIDAAMGNGLTGTEFVLAHRLFQAPHCLCWRRVPFSLQSYTYSRLHSDA